MKKESRYQEAKYLTGTLLFAVVLFAFSLKGFLQEPPASALASPTMGQREPASSDPRQANSPTGISAKDVLETWTWDCKDPKTPPQILGSHVRLKSKFCDKAEPQELKVTNQSNGYTASVFLSGKGFSTDFIDLKEGENNIKIEWKTEKGKVVRELAVLRLPSSEPVSDGGAD